MFVAAQVAIRFNGAIREFSDRLRGKGKPNKARIIACARKLLITLNTMLKTNAPWEDLPVRREPEFAKIVEVVELSLNSKFFLAPQDSRSLLFILASGGWQSPESSAGRGLPEHSLKIRQIKDALKKSQAP